MPGDDMPGDPVPGVAILGVIQNKLEDLQVRMEANQQSHLDALRDSDQANHDRVDDLQMQVHALQRATVTHRELEGALENHQTEMSATMHAVPEALDDLRTRVTTLEHNQIARTQTPQAETTMAIEPNSYEPNQRVQTGIRTADRWNWDNLEPRVHAAKVCCSCRRAKAYLHIVRTKHWVCSTCDGCFHRSHESTNEHENED